jgi:hypothetical protein
LPGRKFSTFQGVFSVTTKYPNVKEEEARKVADLMKWEVDSELEKEEWIGALMASVTYDIELIGPYSALRDPKNALAKLSGLPLEVQEFYAKAQTDWWFANPEMHPDKGRGYLVYASTHDDSGRQFPVAFTTSRLLAHCLVTAIMHSPRTIPVPERIRQTFDLDGKHFEQAWMVAFDGGWPVSESAILMIPK